MKYLVLALCIHLIQAAVLPEADVLTEEIPLQAQVLSGDELLEYLKKNQRLFEVEATPAGHNFDRKLMDLSFINQNRKPVFDDKNDKGEDIPESFDSRTKWPKCSSLKHIRDQANCGSCWAVSTASALSDRICIASNGRKQVHVSATDILSCCGTQCGYGCNGGWPIQAFNYFSKQGAVTGGDYKATTGCRPYPFHPCGHHGKDTYYGECPNEATTPKCVRKCQKSYKKSYKKDRSIGKDAYEVPNSEKAIQREIMKNGPVVGAFTVYEDFSYYKKGIYKHTAGKARGGHAIKIIGWGKENGVPYWLIANSWHNDWGENGYFRILRGSNHCGIEENVVAGHV